MANEVKDRADHAGQAVKSMGESGQKLLDKATDKAGDIADKGKDLVNRIADEATHAGEKVQGWAEDAYEASRKEVKKDYDATAQIVENYGQEVTDLVKKYPIQSLLVGFAAGFLVSRAVKS